MNKNWRNVFLAFIKKELTETLHTMTPILLFSIVVTNVLQYVTMQNVMKLNLPAEDSSKLLGYQGGGGGDNDMIPWWNMLQSLF